MNFLRNVLSTSSEVSSSSAAKVCSGQVLGLIAGSGSLPKRIIAGAAKENVRVVAICHVGETDAEIEGLADEAVWLKIGQLGAIISTFKEHGVRQAIMAGGINRVKLFGGVKLDLRGAALLAKLRSAKDDVLMRGIAEELATEGVEVIESTTYLGDCMAPLGVLTKSPPNEEERSDIQVGIDAIKAIGDQHIGQTVVVKEGVVVAVEAVEGTDAAILRGGELGGKGCVVVKFAKPSQDMRFDVPTVGPKTLESMQVVGARVLALEAGRTMMLDPEDVIKRANKAKICILGCE